MWHPPQEKVAGLAYERLQGYVTDLELEIDRLRKQSEFIQQEALATLKGIQKICAENPRDDRSNVNEQIACKIGDFTRVLDDLNELPDSNPVDWVVDFAVRPLIEKVFRWQQLVHSATHMQLNLTLGCEQIAWFPVRFRHILDNLVSNAIKFRDASKGETRLTIGLTALADAYEMRFSDNGIGIPTDSRETVQDFHRAIPLRQLGTGVGLSVVKALVEQCGGNVAIDSSTGKGTSVVVVLPRFDIEDCLS